MTGGRARVVAAWGLLMAVPNGCGDPLAVSETFDEGFFTNGGIELHYVIDLPAGEGPFPAAVFVHGSGPKTIGDYSAIAERFVERGIAVMRYDKRGTGDSGGTFTPSNVPGINQAIPRDYVADAAAAFRKLVEHLDVDPGRAGFMGESQAGWTIPPAAVEVGDAAFVVLLSGPTIALGDVGAYEARAAARPDLGSDEIMDLLEAEGALMGGGFDPTPALEALEAPGLWLFGAKDVHVPAPWCARVIDALAAQRGRAFTSQVYPNGDHGLRDAGTGDGIPYWDDVVGWLAARGIR